MEAAFQASRQSSPSQAPACLFPWLQGAPALAPAPAPAPAPSTLPPSSSSYRGPRIEVEGPPVDPISAQSTARPSPSLSPHTRTPTQYGIASRLRYLLISFLRQSERERACVAVELHSARHVAPQNSYDDGTPLLKQLPLSLDSLSFSRP